MREDKSAAVELIGVQIGAVRSAERRGTLARASRGEEWVQEKPGKGEWHSRGGAGGRWAGTHSGGDRRRWSRAPVELEVGERWEGPV